MALLKITKLVDVQLFVFPPPNPLLVVNANAPALIVVTPLKLLLPDRIVVPLPSWVSVPFPEIDPGTRCKAEELKTREALSAMLPVPIVPVAPPLPT